MAETDVKCVKLKSDRRGIYRVNEFYGIHCYQRRRRKKSLTCHGEKRGSRGLPRVLSRTRHGEVGDVTDFLCLVAGMSRACRGLVAYVTGKSA